MRLRPGRPARWMRFIPSSTSIAFTPRSETGLFGSRLCISPWASTWQGEKDILGLWISQTEDAKFWLQVVNELRNRGVQVIFVACVDGLKGFPEAIESVNMSLRKITKNRGSFPRHEALLKLFYLALHNIAKKWAMPIRDWKAALTQFTIRFGDRIPQASSTSRLHRILHTLLSRSC